MPVDLQKTGKQKNMGFRHMLPEFQDLVPAQSTDSCMCTSAFPHAFSGLQKLQRLIFRIGGVVCVFLLHEWRKDVGVW